MTTDKLSARGLLSLLWNGQRAIDVIEASLEMGLFERLDNGPVTLRALSGDLGVIPGRLYKLLDCLESLGLVERRQDVDDILEAVYRSREPLAEAARLVAGPKSIERDRERYGWREIHKKLPEVLRGAHEMPKDAFEWPLKTFDQVAGFEASMAAGAGPIVESFIAARGALFDGAPRDEDGLVRLLDVGGGDGTLGLALVEAASDLRVDVYNLPVTAPLLEEKAGRASADARGRLGFVGGDFLAEPLPPGYGALSFVRVLHDWPADVARMLMQKAFEALPPGGRIIICEEFRSAERLAIQFFWTYFLIGVDSCVSRLREEEHYLRALSEIGFKDASVVPGPFGIITAKRP